MTSFSRRAFLGLLPAPLFAAKPLFEEIPANRSGITWVHENAMSDARNLPEAIGPGCAFFDFDNDGWMDIFLVQSGPADFYKPSKPLRHALYKNNRNGTFTDIAAQAGVAGGDCFGMGCAAADYDNDGNTDLLVTSYGRVTLFKNRGDGTFIDVSEKAGLNAVKSGWTTSAVWFDYNNDGLLDLFLCSYLDFGPPGKHPTCEDNRLGRKYYCVPRLFRPTVNALFRNNGDGTFTDVTPKSAISKALGKGLGVVATDINNDGLIDLWVANDTMANFLFVNRGKDNWEEIGLAAEVAFGENGQARSGMGVDAGDIDGDGWVDLFVTNIDQEMYSLYRNNKDETFTDIAHKQNVAQATRQMSGWGLKFLDFDNDGFTDLFVANGHPDDMIEAYSQSIRYREPLLLFHQENGKLRNVSSEAGPAFQKSFAARGLAVGDFNNDGAIDVLIGVNGGPPVLLQNTAAAGNHWVGIKLQGTKANRDGVGARITWSAGDLRWTRLKNGGGSYLASHDPREILGIGAATKLNWVEVKWPGPSNRVERFTDLAIDRYHTIIEGKGRTST